MCIVSNAASTTTTYYLGDMIAHFGSDVIEDDRLQSLSLEQGNGFSFFEIHSSNAITPGAKIHTIIPELNFYLSNRTVAGSPVYIVFRYAISRKDSSSFFIEPWLDYDLINPGATSSWSVLSSTSYAEWSVFEIVVCIDSLTSLNSIQFTNFDINTTFSSNTGYVTTCRFINPRVYQTFSSPDNADVLEDIRQNTEETEQTTKGIWQTLIDFFTSFFSNLINAVISLFVPSTEDMSDLFEQLNDFFSDRFGFLYAPFDYMIQLMQVFLSSTGSTELTFPGFTIMGMEVWPDQKYDIASDPLVGTICGYVRIGTGILLSGYFIMYLQNFFKERFGTG